MNKLGGGLVAAVTPLHYVLKCIRRSQLLFKLGIVHKQESGQLLLFPFYVLQASLNSS